MTTTNDSRKVGITGASGFVGSQVGKYIHQAGGKVYELGRKPSFEYHEEFIPFSLEEGTDIESLKKLDVIIHLAYDFKPKSYENIFSTNVQGTSRLFELAEQAGVAVIVISTLSAYQGCKSDYGKAKLAIEKIAFDHGYPVIRPGLVFGRSAGGTLGGLQTVAKLSPVLPVPMGGPYLHYLCHYEDLSSIIYECVQKEISDIEDPIIAASEKSMSFQEILQTLAEAEDRRKPILPFPPSIMYYGLKSVETVGIDPGLRSDSVIGLLYPDPNPDFELTREFDTSFREFTPRTKKMGLAINQ